MRRVLALGATAAFALTACAQGGNSSLEGTVLSGNIRTVSAGGLSGADVGAAQQAFGLDVLKALCAKGDPNTTVSPASLADALGLLQAGLHGPEQTTIAKLLHLPEWGDDLVAAQQDRTAALKPLATDPKARVVESNHVWVQNGTKPSQPYLDDVRTAFDADLREVDFAGHPGEATDAINASVDHDTLGMIKKLFDQPLESNTYRVLTNAVALDVKWAVPFDPDSPKAPFTTSKGSTVQVPMMSASEGDFRWTTADGWQAVALPYEGNTLSAVAMLPPASKTTCQAPSAATLATLLGKPQSTTSVRLPRLDLEQSIEFQQTLADLGFADADISHIVQKVVMKVDESGTKAAAATGVAMATGALVRKHEVTFDRPFLLLVRDTKTGSPLFLTWVGDPTQH